MQLNSLCLKMALLALMSTWFAACTSVTNSPSEQPQSVNPYPKQASEYLVLSKQATTEEARQSLRLMAAGRLIQDGHWQQGRLILSNISNLSPTLSARKKLLQAKTALIRSHPKEAIGYLAAVEPSLQLSAYEQSAYHSMLAEAYQQTGNPADAVAERIKLDTRLPDEASRRDNAQALWLILTGLSSVEINTLALEADEGSTLKGWMQLALMAQRYDAKPEALMAGLAQWRQAYPNHPAHEVLPVNTSFDLHEKPRRMALLLPLSGSLAGPGQAVKDGFMAAHVKHQDAGVVNIRFYDTNKADPAILYQQALSDGAQYVVGPLTKANAAKVASLSHPVPTLLLNDLNGSGSPNMYQFGLSPADEAIQVARKARSSGHTSALVIAPQGRWGEEVSSAFITQWQTGGGRLAGVFRYLGHDDFNQKIKRFLHITDSEGRQKQLKQALGRTLEFVPRRRQDFDMIFLLAYPSKARQILPLLNYYYAGDVPVYATSTVYSGAPDSIKDRDLDGVLFCDMPWIFNHHVTQKHWPEQYNSYNRLYALGLDSYALSTELNTLRVFPAAGVRDKSGVLSLDSNGRIKRVLIWGRFKQGVPKPVNEYG